jgi:Na+/H+ antiporter NhaD/arsenite permease-like protein
MRVAIGRVTLAGFVATVVLTLSMYAVAPYLAGAPTDVAGTMARALDASWEIGMLVHFINGTVIVPAIYVYFLYPLLPGPPSARGLVWGVLLWLLARLVGVHGGDELATAISFVAHAAYGVILGRLAAPLPSRLMDDSRRERPPAVRDRRPAGTAGPRTH